jgi:serine/threonine protein kinase
MSSWWSNDRIAATVTETYITQKLGPKKKRVLNSPLAFGAGLTDDTYIDWILERSPRLFLILDDIGCADHIFVSVDRSFDDNDLALNDQAISELGLSGPTAKRFAKRQYAFLVQELCEGAHVDYGDDHIIPVHALPRKQGQQQLSANVDRVRVGDKTFLRRKISLDEDSGIEKIHFILHFKSLQRLKHPHLTSVWATYTYREEGYVLMQPSFDTTLKSFIEDPPKHFRSLPKSEQRDIIVRWIQCLTSGLAYLHDNSYAHQAIRPSNIYIDNHYSVYLGDYGALGALEDKEPAYAKDAYNHGAPEQWQKRATLAETQPLRSTLQSGGRTGRRIRPMSSSAVTARPSRSPGRAPRTPSRASNNHDISATSNTAGTRTSTMSSGSTAPTNYTSSTGSSDGGRRAARAHAVITTLTYSQPAPSKTPFDASPSFPSDVFSMCCVITSLLSLLVSISSGSSKLSPTNIPTHLGKRNRTAGRGGKGGAPADVSWHSNLGQVSTWLDMLDETSAEKPAKKLSLSRKSSADKDSDSESWRWKGFLQKMTNMMRYGFQKDISIRWTAPGGVDQINESLKKWHIETAKCCEGIQSIPAVAEATSTTTNATTTSKEPSAVTRAKSTRSTRSARSNPADVPRTKSRVPTTPSIPEEEHRLRSPMLDSESIIELPGHDVVLPTSPASPVSPLSPMHTRKYDGPAIAELPASEHDAYFLRGQRHYPSNEHDACSPLRDHFIPDSEYTTYAMRKVRPHIASQHSAYSARTRRPSLPNDHSTYPPHTKLPPLPHEHTVFSRRGERHFLPSDYIDRVPCTQRPFQPNGYAAHTPRTNRPSRPVDHVSYSPRRERFLPPPRQTWDFDFQFEQDEHEAQQEHELDEQESYYDESIIEDEELVGLEDWPTPMVYHERHGQGLAMKGLGCVGSRMKDGVIMESKMMDRPRPPTSGLVAVPIRGQHRTGTA